MSLKPITTYSETETVITATVKIALEKSSRSGKNSAGLDEPTLVYKSGDAVIFEIGLKDLADGRQLDLVQKRAHNTLGNVALDQVKKHTILDSKNIAPHFETYITSGDIKFVDGTALIPVRIALKYGVNSDVTGLITNSLTKRSDVFVQVSAEKQTIHTSTLPESAPNKIEVEATTQKTMKSRGYEVDGSGRNDSDKYWQTYRSSRTSDLAVAKAEITCSGNTITFGKPGNLDSSFYQATVSALTNEGISFVQNDKTASIKVAKNDLPQAKEVIVEAAKSLHRQNGPLPTGADGNQTAHEILGTAKLEPKVVEFLSELAKSEGPSR